MSDAADDPRCPECGGPIGQTATYCMHCSADLTEERAAADENDDGAWDGAGTTPVVRDENPDVPGATTSEARGAGRDLRGRIVDALGVSNPFADDGAGRLLDPDGIADNTLTVVVGIAAGIVVGFVGTVVLGVVTGSEWGLLFGLVAWLGATAYLVRRRTVQEAVAKSGYAVAVVLLLVPVVALSPVVSVDGGLADRGGIFLTLLVFVAVPAGIAAGIGWVAGRFVPTDDAGSEG